MAFRKIGVIIALTITLTASFVLGGCSTTSGDVASQDPQLQIGDFSVELQAIEPDDIAQILGITRWKFTLQRDSEEEVGLDAAMIITDPRKPDQVIDEMRIFTTEREVEGMVALYPLGESLFNAGEIRIYLQLGSGSTSSVIPNPFKEYSASYTANPADVLQDDSLRLMAFSDSGPMPSPENTVLALQIESFDSNIE